MLQFIAADLRRNRIGAAILIVLIALATGLGVAVTLQERALRLGSARAAAPFDLVIGAAGSETQLVLSSVFLQPSPLPLLSGAVLAELRADPRVAAVAPVGFGDFIGDYPIVGTTPDAIDILGGIKDGRGFTHPGDAIAGAAVTHAVGSVFHPFHGTAGEPGTVHGHAQYRIVGRLAPSGTPWDRAILVPIQSVWAVHADHAHGAGAEGSPRGETRPHDDDHEHGHSHDDEAARVLDEKAIVSGDNPGVPAIIVKPRKIADAYNLRQKYRRDTTLAVFPGEVLTRLYGTLGDARRVLSAVAIGAQGLVAAAILMVIAIHVLQRRRQIGALRAFGAPRVIVVAMISLEVFLILALGLLLGFAAGYFGASMLSAQFTRASGIMMPVMFQPTDLWTLAGFLAVAALATLLPAAIAYRQTPAQALRS
jgi:putative ABC transport system permease protein